MSADKTLTGIELPQASGPACLVLIYGLRDIGRRWMLETPTLLIGRDPACDVQADLPNVSRKHCELRRAPAGGHVLVDLGSTNGTYVDKTEVRGAKELVGGELVSVGSAIFKYLSGTTLEAQFHDTIYRLAIIDGLTQVYNKRYLLEFVDRELARAQRYGRELSLMMIDVDHFKKINDTFGHIAGDHVLREVAGAVATMVRREECFARYGGEEFALVQPEAAPDKVRVFAEKIRAAIAERKVQFEGREIVVTASIGVARIGSGTPDVPSFLAAADQKLYEAKRSGRNKLVTQDDIGGDLAATA